jgi:hypothetical protein
LLGVIGRKLHQGDRMPRHGVKTHSRRVAALDHRRPNPAAESVGTYVQQILLAALIEPCANWRAAQGGQRTVSLTVRLVVHASVKIAVTPPHRRQRKPSIHARATPCARSTGTRVANDAAEGTRWP